MQKNLGEVQEALKRAAEQTPKPRDFFQRPKMADRSDVPSGRDWSGSAWSGERWSGRNMSGGRDR